MFDTYNNLEDAEHAQPRVAALLSCHDNLMPASWHMPVSKSPFRYAVAVREENYTHQLLQENKSFTLNFLPFEYFETFDVMGKLHGDKHDKITKSALKIEERDGNGNVLLSASDFTYSCEVCDTYKNGDHTIFIADVQQIHVNEKQSGTPTFFSGRGRYSTISDTTIARSLV